jgi:hypothetical protein
MVVLTPAQADRIRAALGRPEAAFPGQVVVVSRHVPTGPRRPTVDDQARLTLLMAAHGDVLHDRGACETCFVLDELRILRARAAITACPHGCAVGTACAFTTWRDRRLLGPEVVARL